MYTTHSDWSETLSTSTIALGRYPLRPVGRDLKTRVDGIIRGWAIYYLSFFGGDDCEKM